MLTIIDQRKATRGAQKCALRLFREENPMPMYNRDLLTVAIRNALYVPLEWLERASLPTSED